MAGFNVQNVQSALLNTAMQVEVVVITAGYSRLTLLSCDFLRTQVLLRGLEVYVKSVVVTFRVIIITSTVLGEGIIGFGSSRHLMRWTTKARVHGKP